MSLLQSVTIACICNANRAKFLHLQSIELKRVVPCMEKGSLSFQRNWEFPGACFPSGDPEISPLSYLDILSTRMTKWLIHISIDSHCTRYCCDDVFDKMLKIETQFLVWLYGNCLDPYKLQLFPVCMSLQYMAHRT